MSPTPTVRPEFARSDVDAVLVGAVGAGGADRRQTVADAVVEHWRSVTWPEGLVALHCFTSTHSDAVLTYEQWSSEAALRAALADPASISRANPGFALATGPCPEPVAYRRHLTVRGTAVGDPPPPAASFPVAAFPMADRQTAEQWIEDLLKSEERAAGKDRAYPGAIAANMHIGLDGRSVLIFSEWITEQQAVAHMEVLTKVMLVDVGNQEDELGALYAHHASVVLGS
ncbi:hypothetical protein ACIQF6_34645 [Kitasatospora sp. NPDC092948]|uniref:hypothetical protein n=1 Tax=Kitasatospora sp. NPDC092948 TaxID=3364088 RepID=UPI00381E2FCA